MTYTCSACAIEQPLACFSVDRSRKQGHMTRCKTCMSAVARDWYIANRARAIKRSQIRKHERWGVTQEAWAACLIAQAGRCAICSDELRQAHTDHDHETGRFRALLCHLCNPGLGMFVDDPARLEAAAAYVRSHRA